ncbi:hypothetical protein I4F81_003414 [Pyropia yezoensis]|uniref:Uncharacterized protein n=1 Tax=Pyropia yezoensis TaxID=2788 RepID=A0ACC3BSC3_PYRYE|nr:hypothetical protein I4F81_003414 [Neopyropia yezoensis]
MYDTLVSLALPPLPTATGPASSCLRDVSWRGAPIPRSTHAAPPSSSPSAPAFSSLYLRSAPRPVLIAVRWTRGDPFPLRQHRHPLLTLPPLPPGRHPPPPPSAFSPRGGVPVAVPRSRWHRLWPVGGRDAPSGCHQDAHADGGRGRQWRPRRRHRRRCPRPRPWPHPRLCPLWRAKCAAAAAPAACYRLAGDCWRRACPVRGPGRRPRPGGHLLGCPRRRV